MSEEKKRGVYPFYESAKIKEVDKDKDKEKKVPFGPSSPPKYGV
ncbi:MAG: hypothetical protein ACTSR3_15935 [Candidatus Helarchaeota archaeon]